MQPLRLYIKHGVILFIWCVSFVLFPEKFAIPWMFSIIPVVLYLFKESITNLPVLITIAFLIPFLKFKGNVEFIVQYDIFLFAAAIYVWNSNRKMKAIDMKFLPEIAELKSKLEQNEQQVSLLEKSLKELKSELAKSTELYRLSKEVVEHLYLKDIFDHFCRIVFAQEKFSKVVSSIVFFQFDFEKQTVNEETMYFTDAKETQLWIEIIQARQKLLSKREVSKFVSIKHFPFDTIILYPVALEEILGYFAFRVKGGDEVGDKRSEQEFIAELEPFFGQLSLAIRRCGLFLEVEKRSRRDGLTGLFLRRYFLERLEEEVLRAKRYKNKFAVIMIDIDYFKKVNDTYGHQAGDFVLKSLAGIFESNLHKGDLIGRYGGEEFVVCLPYTKPDECKKVAENIRSIVENTSFVYDGKNIHITISLGIAYYPEDAQSKDELIVASDKAMYFAKQLGRNRTVEFRRENHK
ncbi:MAG: GGDEF domain-containing protein [Elusimicrobiota bacterium]|nr:GGDEF domain-containing protein [Elusimicrobiota bacterium]